MIIGLDHIVLVVRDLTASADRFSALLGVAPTATQKEITTAYRGLARTLHPDTNPDKAAEDYRLRVLGQMGPEASEEERATVREQLSGACTIEIAAFDEFVGLLSGEAAEFGRVALRETGGGADGDGRCRATGDHGGGGFEEFGDTGADFLFEFGQRDEVARGFFHGLHDFGRHDGAAEHGDNTDSVDDRFHAEARIQGRGRSCSEMRRFRRGGDSGGRSQRGRFENAASSGGHVHTVYDERCDSFIADGGGRSLGAEAI